MLRGNDGQFEICWPVNRIDPKSGAAKKEFVAQRYYVSLPSCLDALMKMKISHSEARTLAELQDAVKAIRKEMIEIYG